MYLNFVSPLLRYKDLRLIHLDIIGTDKYAALLQSLEQLAQVWRKRCSLVFIQLDICAHPRWKNPLPPTPTFTVLVSAHLRMDGKDNFHYSVTILFRCLFRPEEELAKLLKVHYLVSTLTKEAFAENSWMRKGVFTNGFQGGEADWRMTKLNSDFGLSSSSGRCVMCINF